jgi:RNase P subunit RPR2
MKFKKNKFLDRSKLYVRFICTNCDYLETVYVDIVARIENLKDRNETEIEVYCRRCAKVTLIRIKYEFSATVVK